MMKISLNSKTNILIKRITANAGSKSSFFLVGRLNARLCRLNQRSRKENLAASCFIFIMLILMATLYFLLACYMFHALWYHILFSIISTLIFTYLCCEYYFELLDKKIKTDLPKCCRKLAHYYSHYKGNVTLALREAEERGPESTRLYMIKLRKALEAVRSKEQIEELKRNIPYTWIKMLCMLLMLGKLNGSSYSDPSGDAERTDGMLEKNLRRITNVLSLLNIEQGYSDAELQGIELFMFLCPYFFIAASELFNKRILIEMNIGDVYTGVEAQTMKALIFIVGNASALFIRWMRKQQD